MRQVLALGLLAACAHQPTVAPAQQLVSADPAGLRKMVREPLTTGGLTFADSACAAKFSRPRDIDATQLDAFAQCLAGLHLQLSPRKDALDDVVVLTYAPGIEVEARIVDEPAGPRLTWIGFESRRDSRDALPTISGDTLERLRTSGTRDSGPAGEWAWLKVCLDSSGAVTGAHVRLTTSLAAADAFKQRALAWTFHPMTIGTQPVPVCAMVQMTSPTAEHGAETLPLPLPAGPDDLVALAAAPKLLTTTQLIAPDPDAKTAILRAGLTEVKATLEWCVAPTGAVQSVSTIRSSGVPRYDAELLAGIQQWRFAAYPAAPSTPVTSCGFTRFRYVPRGPGDPPLGPNANQHTSQRAPGDMPSQTRSPSGPQDR